MPISLKLPELDENPVLLAETRASKLNEFIRDLPFSDPIKAADDLIEELKILNSQKVAFANRVNALEVYRPAAMQLSLALIPQFSYASLPISVNQKAFADTAIRLWEEIAFGYKWALIDLQNKIFSINNNKSCALVIQRAIHALKEVIYTYHLTYQTPDKSLWSELHQLYFSALLQDVQSIPVNEDHLDGASSVDAAYIQVSLLALMNPHRLAGRDIVKANTYLEKIAEDAELKPLGFVESSTSVFLLELDGDQPPKVYAKNKEELNNETDLLLITTRLAKRIHTHLKLLKDGITPNDGSLPNTAQSDHYEDLLKHLITYFGKSPLRVYSRSKKNDGVELGIGIHDACYFVPKIGNDYKNLVVQHAAIKPSRWQILNIGAGGYALRKFNSSQVSMQVGDIAAIKNNETLTWELGVIRWASINVLNQLDIGFELISPGAKAIKLKSTKNNIENEGLLLPEISALKQQTSFIVKRGEYTIEDTLELINGETKNKVIITHLVERTTTFERYQYNLI